MTSSSSSAATAEGMADFQKAFAGLEEHIIKAQRFAQLVAYLCVEDLIQVQEDRNGRFFRVTELVGMIITFMAEETEDACDALLSAYNLASRLDESSPRAAS